MLRFDSLRSAIHEKPFHTTNLTIQLNYDCPEMAGESERDEYKKMS